MLKIKNINKSYFNKDNTVSVLNDISIQIKKGHIVSIIGESGIGKSTLLNIIGGLIRPDSGDIYINNQSINYDLDTSKLRKKIFGFIFQSHCLLQEFTVLENLILPQIIADKMYSISVNKAKEYLNLLNMEHKAHAYPNSLSAGQCQRVSVIRSIINDPSILIADEPTGNLDKNNSELILDLFVKLNKSLEQTIVIATHDKNVMKISDLTYEIKNGKLELM